MVADQRLELAAIRRGNRKRNFCAHAKDSAHETQIGKTKRELNVRFYPIASRSSDGEDGFLDLGHREMADRLQVE